MRVRGTNIDVIGEEGQDYLFFDVSLSVMFKNPFSLYDVMFILRHLQMWLLIKKWVTSWTCEYDAAFHSVSLMLGYSHRSFLLLIQK